ncbi:hypothetical protein [Enterococcus sp. DIV0187]|uniref:hypothetical protein n=1 Tax=Enterococcus sp. DIV0187 TaxID=2774644 RepID=UPI003F2193FE
MSGTIAVLGMFMFLTKVILYALTSKFDWLQRKDKLTWRRGFKRNRYELLLKFEDGRLACYTLYANYSKYQAADLVAKLFDGHSFVGIEVNHRACYYHSSQIIKIETQKMSVNERKKGSM